MSAAKSPHFDARLLASDAGVALLLADEARQRLVTRVFGVPKGDSLLVTVIALGVLGGAIHDKAVHRPRLPIHPSLADAMLGTALLDESLHRIAGDWSRQAPRFGTLVAIAVLGASLRPMIKASLHRVEASGRRARAGWGRRYGHLIGARSRSA